jgi:hypothetical protein
MSSDNTPYTLITDCLNEVISKSQIVRKKKEIPEGTVKNNLLFNVNVKLPIGTTHILHTILKDT